MVSFLLCFVLYSKKKKTKNYKELQVAYTVMAALSGY